MLVFEFKTYGKLSEFTAVDEAIRTAQFVRNSCLRYWIDNQKVDKYNLNKYCAVLAGDFPFASESTRTHVLLSGYKENLTLDNFNYYL